MSDPIAVLGQLEELTTDLGLLSNAIYTDREKFAELSASYDDARADTLEENVTL